MVLFLVLILSFLVEIFRFLMGNMMVVERIGGWIGLVVGCSCVGSLLFVVCCCCLKDEEKFSGVRIGKLLVFILGLKFEWIVWWRLMV